MTTDRLESCYRAIAEERPDDVALAFVDVDSPCGDVTWGQLWEMAEAIVPELAAADAGPGAVIAVENAGSARCVASYIAVWILGATVVPIDPQWGHWLRQRIVEQSTAVAVVPAAASPVERLGRTADERSREVSDATAIVSYTSGSTGDPKGVLLRHSHLLHAYRSGATELARLAGSLPTTIGCAMRVSGLGVFGIHYLWAAVLGAQVVTVPELTVGTGSAHWQRLAAVGADVTYLVPPLVALLNRVGSAPAGARLPVCMTGGAPLSATLQSRFQERFRTPLLNFYGLTEVGFTAFFGSVGADGMAAPDIGRPGIVLARLRSPATGAVLLEAEAEGELEVAGPSLADGYLGNRAGWEAIVTDGWLRTGDIAGRDRDGRYRIVGRSKDVVNRGGHAIYLNEVEAAALELDGVVEAGAIRLVLPEELEDIGLVLRTSEPATGLLDRLRDAVGPDRVPRRIVVTPDPLPRIGQSKLDRVALAVLWGELTRTSENG